MRCRKSVVREWHCLLGLLLFSICIVCSCEDSDERRVAKMIEDWTGRTILMPKESVFTLYGGDTVSFLKDYICADYKIINYVDSTDCVSCKLQISSWKVFLATLDSVGTDLERIIPVLFYMCPKESAELKFILHREGFNYPICIDEKDSLNKLNHFPSDINYQTFLLDKDNKVLAIGNPVLNPKVKDLYLRIIRGESPQASSDAGTPVTTVSVSSAEADLGTFPWQEPRTCTFTLRNTGDRPLVIHDVTTSCGCLTVDYPEEPAAWRWTTRRNRPVRARN